MEPRPCDHCGTVVENEGIRHRRRLFCSDECCEAFEDRFMENGEPDDLDLDDPLDDSLDSVDEDSELVGLTVDEDLDSLDEGF